MSPVTVRSPVIATSSRRVDVPATSRLPFRSVRPETVRVSLITTSESERLMSPVPFAVIVTLPLLLVAEIVLPSILMLSISALPAVKVFDAMFRLPLTVTLLSNVAAPVTSRVPPIFRFLAIPTPPEIIRSPVVVEVDCRPSVILTVSVIVVSPLILKSLLNLTGPSNCDRIVPEFPPSTRTLSLMMTSSKTTLSLEGS